ncbi:SAM-dependent methyltransferase [Streptacidiphilus monticola]
MRTDIAHPARIYNAWLGGKDHFPADRSVADHLARMTPDVVASARANRAFLGRAVRAVSALGVRQFLDIGTGIPAAGNTHEVAQSVDRSARVAYVDNDPIVLAHARALMNGPGHGATTVTQADLRDPEAILAAPGVRGLLDLSEPVALVLVAVLHFVSDEEDPQGIVKRLLSALAPGSVLVLSHGTDDTLDRATAAEVAHSYDRAAAHLHLRPKAAVERLFAGTELLEPGVVLVPYWRPSEPLGPDADRLGVYGGVGVLRAD